MVPCFWPIEMQSAVSVPSGFLLSLLLAAVAGPAAATAAMTPAARINFVFMLPPVLAVRLTSRSRSRSSDDRSGCPNADVRETLRELVEDFERPLRNAIDGPGPVHGPAAVRHLQAGVLVNRDALADEPRRHRVQQPRDRAPLRRVHVDREVHETQAGPDFQLVEVLARLLGAHLAAAE